MEQFIVVYAASWQTLHKSHVSWVCEVNQLAAGWRHTALACIYNMIYSGVTYGNITCGSYTQLIVA